MSSGMGNHQAHKTTVDEVLVAAGRPPVKVAQRGRRSRQLHGLLHHGPLALLQLLDAEEDGSAAQLHDDVKWLTVFTDMETE